MVTRVSVTLALVALAGCSGDPIVVNYAGASGQSAAFIVENHSDQDVMAISFEIDFRAPSGSPLSLDTMDFEVTSLMAGDTIPFVEAGEETTFNARLPTGAVSARARVLEVTYRPSSMDAAGDSAGSQERPDR